MAGEILGKKARCVTALCSRAMKKNNLVKLLGVALVVAIISTGIFYGLFVNKLSSSTGSGKTLVVAAKALKPGTVVALADLKTIPWPTDQLPKGAYETPDQIAGSTVFDSIDQDEPVLADGWVDLSGVRQHRQVLGVEGIVHRVVQVEQRALPGRQRMGPRSRAADCQPEQRRGPGDRALEAPDQFGPLRLP